VTGVKKGKGQYEGEPIGNNTQNSEATKSQSPMKGGLISSSLHMKKHAYALGFISKASRWARQAYAAAHPQQSA